MTRSLYNTPDVHINDLLRDAHPAGSANIIDSPSREGVVEDSIEAQMQALKMVYKQPVAKVMASLAETLESLGVAELSNSIDKIAFDFYHEPLLVKVAAADKVEKCIVAVSVMKQILVDYAATSGRPLLKSIYDNKSKFISTSTWKDMYDTAYDWLVDLGNAKIELDDVIEYFKENKDKEMMLTDGVTKMHFYQKTNDIFEEIFLKSDDIKELTNSHKFINEHGKPIDELVNALKIVMSDALKAADEYGEGVESAGERNKTTEVDSTSNKTTETTDERSKTTDGDNTSGKAPVAKKPGPGPKQEQAAEPVWSIPVTFEGKVIENFPLSYILQQNNPWVYFEVLKLYGIVPVSWSAEKALEATDAQPLSLVKRFTDTLNKAIDTILVPKNKQYARAKEIVTSIFLKLDVLVNKTKGIEGERGRSGAKDFMEVVVEQHPALMAQVPRNSPLWNSIRMSILQEYNQHGDTGGIIADSDGMAGPMQQRALKARQTNIRSLIYNMMRAQGMIR